MPKDHLNSIKQQKNQVFIYKNKNIAIAKKSETIDELPAAGHQRKLSFSDIFDLRFVACDLIV